MCLTCHFIDLGSYGELVRKLVYSGQPQLAEALFRDNIVGRGIDPDLPILNSMMGGIPCKAACNAMIWGLYAHDRILEAFDYLVRVNEAGVTPGILCFNKLIYGLCYKGYMDEALELFDVMRCGHVYPPTLHLYKSIFYGLCKRGLVVEAESLFREMESQGIYIDRKMKMAMRVFLRMLKTDCEPDNYTYNTLIHGFLKLGLFDKGRLVYKQMAGWGMQPDAVTNHLFISKYCREGKVDCALMLFNNMLSCNLAPNVQCYMVLINALYKENRLLEVYDLFKSMLVRVVVPDHVLSFVLMKKYPERQRLHLAHLILQAIAKNGCGFDPSMLSSSASVNSNWDLEREIEILIEGIVRCNFNLANVAFSVIVIALCGEGKPNDALLYMDKIVRVGCMPSLFTYNSLIRCLCQKGLFEDAKYLLDLMQDRGVVPNQATYLIMVNEHCKRGDLVSAFNILDQMDERGLRPNVAIYDTIIEEMFKRMLESGVDPDEAVYVTMINGYSKNGRAIEAHQLFDITLENSIQPSSYSYTALITISGLVKKNMTYKGCIYLDKMLGDGLQPNAVLYTSLISLFLKKGQIEFAFRLVDLMDRNQIDTDLIMYISLVSGVSRNISGIKKEWYVINKKSDRERNVVPFTLMPMKKILRISADTPEEMKWFALKLMQKFKDIEFMPNLAERMWDAYDHFEKMQREGVHPNEVTYSILIDGHIRSGDIDSAIGLFNKMVLIVYNTSLKGLCKAGRVLNALPLSYTMRKRGVFPNQFSYECLLSCFCASDVSVPAFKIFEEMLAQNYKPKQFNHNWLLCKLCENNKFLESPHGI
ncbi:hypothetical protein ACB092_05G004000 [Castanea dentata]